MPWNKKKVGGKWCIFKEGADKPIGECHDTEQEANDQLAALFANEKKMSASNVIEREIFAVGKWNGMEFTESDLHAIAAAFELLQNNHQVPLKFGHNDQQPMTDGQPALGWVDRVWVDGQKLLARFTDLPAIVYEAMKKKLYKNVSVELDIGVNYKGNTFPFVLSGVALLGADIPAVNTLKDLTHYLRRSVNFSAGRRAVFSANADNQEGGNIMELAELTKKIAELTAQVSTLTTENAAFKAEKLEMSAKIAKFETDAKTRDEVEAKARVSAKRAQIVGLLEEGVKSEAITPAAREQFSKLMRIDDDVAVMAIDVEEVKKLTANGKKQFSKEQGRQTPAGEGTLSVDQQVADGIKEIMAKKEASDFFAAQALLFSRNPKLAREYVDFNNA